MTIKKDINERNREFWEKETQKFQERAAKRPHDLQHVVHKTSERVEDGAIGRVKSLEAQMAELDALRGADQSVRAKGRRKRARSHRDIVIDAMRPARREQRTFIEFLDSAEKGSISGIEIRRPGPRDGGKFLITCDELDSDAKFSKSTIEGWWTAADSQQS
ncbi:hypothetical protein [Paraburkholderia ferrariae]|uniref:Uncharacterized protein n=1 Tax=Paraburkholderia ferrariae TaxID=386056 RepID=A0ABU9RHW9_9BURK